MKWLPCWLGSAPRGWVVREAMKRAGQCFLEGGLDVGLDWVVGRVEGWTSGVLLGRREKRAGWRTFGLLLSGSRERGLFEGRGRWVYVGEGCSW